MWHTKGKKGQAEIWIIVGIVALIAGVFVADKAGLFTLSNVISPYSNPELNSIAHAYYYDATNTGPATCQVTQASTTRRCIQEGVANGCANTNVVSQECNVCGGSGCTSRPVDCGPWNPGGQQIKDEGLYACKDGNVVLQFCGSLGSTLVEQCDLGCSYQPYQLSSGVFVNTVKCDGDYDPNKNICGSDGRTLFKTDSSGNLNTITCDYSCFNGQCVDCKEGSQICLGSTQIQKCIGGVWTNTATCSGLDTCSQSGTGFDTTASCSSTHVNGELQCSGNQPVIYDSNIKNFKNNGPACTTSCVAGECKDECNVDSCVAGALYDCQVSAAGNENVKVADCVSGYCNDEVTCLSNYEIGKTYCVNGDVYIGRTDTSSNKASTGGIALELQNDCTIGCSESGGVASCTKLPKCVGNEGKDVCTVGTSIGTCSADGQKISNERDCKTATGNSDAYCDASKNPDSCSVPEDECSGTQICSNGQIFSCTNNKIGSKLYDCASNSCSAEGVSCTNECSSVGQYSCVDSSTQGLCVKDTNNNLAYQRTQCGADGCNSVTGKCNVAGTPNSFICERTSDYGGKVYQTDVNGFKIGSVIVDCSQVSPKDSLQPFCVQGSSKCNFCTPGAYICGTNERFQCDDPTVPTKKNVESCEAGCFVDATGTKCDQLQVVISPTQNFKITGSNVAQVTIQGKLTGSQTNKGILTDYVATIKGTTTDTKTGKTNADGTIIIPFGDKPIGAYTVDITFPEYPDAKNKRVVSVSVTNDYVVKVVSAAVQFKIPNSNPSVSIEATNQNGDAPTQLQLSNVPAGLTKATVLPGNSVGKFTLQFDGAPGIYTVGVKPISGTTTLEEQMIQIELRKPTLSVNNIIPASTKPGKYQYDLNIVGPTESSQTSNLKPDNITATISHSPAVPLQLNDLGNGKYSFNYDFSSPGTYTVTVTAQKEGYETAQFSKVIEVSGSGTSAPPGGSASSAGTQTPVTSPAESPSGLKGILMVVLIIGAVLYFGRKKN